MFIISCKNSDKTNYIYNLIDSIRKYHFEEKIVIVDSCSSNKNYFNIKQKYKNIEIEDINNKNWMIGAYWHAYKKYKEEDDFFYFLHDSCLLKNNISYIRNNPITTLMYFDRQVSPVFNGFKDKINTETKYTYKVSGLGCFGPIFFCKKEILESFLSKDADKILPKNKTETFQCEGCFGFFIENEGFDLSKISLYGDILGEEIQKKIGNIPHKTDWMYPVEKIFASYQDNERL
jgi:hypothetical protein